MKIIPSSLRPTLFLGALAAVFSLAFGSRALAVDSPSQHIWTISIPAGVTPAEVQHDIVAVLSGRHWEVTAQAPGRTVGYIKHRGDEAFVTFVCTTSTVDLFCQGWKIDKSTGEREKPAINGRWMNYLQQDLNKLLYPPPPH